MEELITIAVWAAVAASFSAVAAVVSTVVAVRLGCIAIRNHLAASGREQSFTSSVFLGGGSPISHVNIENLSGVSYSLREIAGTCKRLESLMSAFLGGKGDDDRQN